MTSLPSTTPSAAGFTPSPARTPVPLIVATVGGGDAAGVLAAARLLAERFDAAPHVVAVNEPLQAYLPGIPMESVPPDLYTEQRRRLLEDVTRAVAAAGVPAWSVEVLEGPPARTIAHVASERKARCIVIGIGRHAPMDRLLGDETALHVVRLADRPVLAVTPDFAALPRHAAVAVDFSPASVRAAEEALALLAEGGRLSLVHVRPPADVLLRRAGETLSRLHDRRLEELWERLAAGLAAPPSVTIEPVVLAGDPADELLGFAARERADLVATGSSGLGFLDRLVMGSVATQIVRRAPVPVLAVPRPSAADVERIEALLASTVESTEAARWPRMLEAFSERNAGRPTQLEIDDPALGAQLEERGYTLLGASYDRRGDRLELMLAAPAGGAGHLTHTIGGVTSVAVFTDPHHRDLALQARHGEGQTILTFPD